MNPLELPRPRLASCARLAAVVAAIVAGFSQPLQATEALPTCPMPGWSEGLAAYLLPNASFPVNDTAQLPTPDCNFHEWSWEAFAWATALDGNGQPRFLSLPTPGDLSLGEAGAKIAPRKLKLGVRPFAAKLDASAPEFAGAIVEADGNMLVAPNGYPVYASVHMNPSYFATAQRNLIKTGGYASQPANDYFEVGAAVFKATWLRLDPGQAAPAGAFVTQAEVPVLAAYRTKSSLTVAATRETVVVNVALVGLHVVGYTVNHPEFLWATFEHNLNSPKFADNTWDATSTASDPNNYTFYQGGTPWNHVNYNQGNQAAPFLLKFDLGAQKFTTVTVPNNVANFTYSGTSPSTSRGTNVVLANQTGSETNSPSGPANIQSLNTSAQGFYAGLKTPQTTFGNYFLVGTVWMEPNTYVATNPAALGYNNTNAVGSVNLANTTAETFFQVPKVVPTNTAPSNNTMQNCFLCHNATSFNPPLNARLVAISHVLSEGTSEAVSNSIPVLIPSPQGATPDVKAVGAPNPRRK